MRSYNANEYINEKTKKIVEERMNKIKNGEVISTEELIKLIRKKRNSDNGSYQNVKETEK